MLIAIAVIIIAVGALLAWVATQPDSFRIERGALIKAKPATIYGLLDDFHRWGVWSPWEKLDPDMKRTYDGPTSGKGAIYGWAGGAKAGEGRMEILEAPAPEKLVIQLDFIKPFPASNTAEFILVPEGDATRVTWAMLGRRPFMIKLMGLVMNMDKMVGGDFEKGLADLKAAAEAA